MVPVTVCCVWQGNKYGSEYVDRLRNMVARHMTVPYHFVCYTDRDELRGLGIDIVPSGGLNLPGWWGKMATFMPSAAGRRRIYFDLDTVITGDLTPLATYDGPFAVCENFTKLAGHPNWPCDYGSCVMSLPPDWGWHVWDRFWSNRDFIMRQCTHGDQQAIEQLHPGAVHLQDVMPEGYFIGYRDLSAIKPDGASIVIFAGASKPDNCNHRWVTDEWR